MKCVCNANGSTVILYGFLINMRCIRGPDSCLCGPFVDILLVEKKIFEMFPMQNILHCLPQGDQKHLM